MLQCPNSNNQSNLFETIIKQCRQFVECDTARISKPLDNMYLIIGFNRNTKNDDGLWIKNGEPFNFNYVAEKVIASGRTEKEIIESCKNYKDFS